MRSEYDSKRRNEWRRPWVMAKKLALRSGINSGVVVNETSSYHVQKDLIDNKDCVCWRDERSTYSERCALPLELLSMISCSMLALDVPIKPKSRLLLASMNPHAGDRLNCWVARAS